MSKEKVLAGYRGIDKKTFATVAHNQNVMDCNQGELIFEHAFIDLAAICQYECEACFNQELNATGASLSWETKTDIVDLLEEKGGRIIAFAGSGEPLLDQEMLPTVEYAKVKGINTVMFSSLTTQDENGTILPVDKALLARLHRLGVSIVAKRNSLDDKKQEEILGRPGSGAGRAMYEGLQRAIDAGFTTDGRLLVDCPIDRESLAEVPGLLRYCRGRDILPYFEAYINFGQEKATINGLKIFAKELSELFLELQKIDKEEFGISTTLRSGMRIYAADVCMQPLYGFAVKVNGDIRTCPTDPRTKIGNIYETPLREILSPTNETYRKRFGIFGCSQCYKEE